MQSQSNGRELRDDRERRKAAIRLLAHWLREDQNKVNDDGSWERLKSELDRDRSSARSLFS